jgi:glycosyltransferase involved in cell wall biosynthesis
MKIDLYHNIRWSLYKASVFRELHRIAVENGYCVRFTHVADTSGQRKALSAVDLSWHDYPHEVLFEGVYEEVPKLKLYKALFSRVLRSDADLILVQGFDRPEHWLMLLAAVLSRKKASTFCDSTLNDRRQGHIKGALKRFFFSCCSGVFCYGERAREYLLHYGVPPHKIFQRYQAAALPESYKMESIPCLREQAAAENAGPMFLYVGRLASEKGLQTLVLAFANAKHHLPGSRLIMVGGGSEENILKKLAASLGLEKDVVFTGGLSQESLSRYYLSATCLVLPSRSEPWGLVVNEALHYGCPVVVSERCGCVPELVKEGVSGYSFPVDDVTVLSKRLIQAVTEFSDARTVAQRCLDVIGPYDPATAASQLLEGCCAMLDRSTRR